MNNFYKDYIKEINLKNMDVVLIADRTYQGEINVNLKGRDLEMISNEYFDEIYNGLNQICRNVIHYESPEELIDNICKHKDDLVLTIFGGRCSRNRMGLVPAICESYNVKYIGADTYARMLCQDKVLSKQFASRFNIPVPNGIVIDNEIDLNQLKKLRLPLVVKPNFEGSSIGVSENSKVHSFDDAIRLINALLKDFKDSIIVEEFISGKEVCICIVGSKKSIALFKAMEVYDQSEPDFLKERIYSAKGKHLSDRFFKHRDVTKEISEEQRSQILRLYKSLGKMDFMRIDGRLNSSGFTMIELTPDAYLGKSSAINDAAAENELSYGGLLETIITTYLNFYTNATKIHADTF